jgi:hypothetical protein
MANGEGPKITQEGLKESDLPKPRDQFRKNGKTYVVCDRGKCWYEPHEDEMGISCWTVWADPDAAPKCKDPCECMLLQASTWDQKPKWEPVPDNDKQSKRHGRDIYKYLPKSFVYWCVCVRVVP